MEACTKSETRLVAPVTTKRVHAVSYERITTRLAHLFEIVNP